MSRPLPPWRALVGSSLALGALSASQIGIAVMVPELRIDFGLSIGQAGVLLGAAEFALAATVLAWGYAADRLGEKRCLIAGLIGGGMAIAAASRSSTFAVLLCGLLVLGLFGGAICTAGPRIVLGAFNGGRRVLALSVRQSAIPLGGLIAASVIGPIAISRGTDTGLLVLGLAMLVVAVLAAAAILPRSLEVKEAPVALQSSPLTDSRVWRLAAASALLLFGEVALLGFSGLFLVEQQGFTTPEAGLIVAAMLGIGVLLLLVVGSLADHRRQRVGPLRVMIVLIGAAYLAVALVAGEKSLLAVAALVTAGALSQAWLPLLTAILGDLIPRARHGTAIGVQQTAMSVLAALSPVLFGLVVERFSWQAAFVFLTISMVLPLVLIRGLSDLPGPSLGTAQDPSWVR